MRSINYFGSENVSFSAIFICENKMLYISLLPVSAAAECLNTVFYSPTMQSLKQKIPLTF